MSTDNKPEKIEDIVVKIADLARLSIEEDSIQHLGQQLGRIMEFVAQMDSVDTSQVLPMAHPQDQVQRLREDKVTEQDQRAHFQKIAPQVEDGLYLVPKVIEKAEE